jgi:hypothetical protein
MSLHNNENNEPLLRNYKDDDSPEFDYQSNRFMLNDTKLEPIEMSKISESPTFRSILKPHRLVNLEKECLIDDDDQKDSILKEQGMGDVFKASYHYTVRLMKKEKAKVLIGCSTISLIVFITSFICVFM